MKKYLYISIYFVIFETLLNAQKPQNVSNSKPPNFLFVLVDDQPFDAVEEELRLQATILKKQYKYNPKRDWWLNQVMKSKGTNKH